MTIKNIKGTSLTVILLILCVGNVFASGGKPTENNTGNPNTACGKIDTSLPVLHSGFSVNVYNTRNNPSNINSTNITDLEVHMQFAGDDVLEKRGAPAVTQQAVYFHEGAYVIAANREKGCEFWRFKVKDESDLLAGDNFARSSSILYTKANGSTPATVAFGDYFGYVYVLDAETGAEIWSQFAGESTKLHMITGGLQSFDGKLLVPVATKEVLYAPAEVAQICCDSHGLLRLYDLATGDEEWTYETTSRARFRVRYGSKGPSGVSIWGTPAVDEARGLIYVPTAQNLTRPTTDNSDSIIAIKISNGKEKWIYQSTENDAWNAACSMSFPLDTACDGDGGLDHDFGAPPIIADLPDGGQAIIAGAKNGVVYSLNPETGNENWARRIGVGGTLGGIHWGMAIDAKNVYAATTDITVYKATKTEILSLLDIGEAAAESMVQNENATPGIYAINLSTGDIDWQINPKAMYDGEEVDRIFSAALTVTNDVLFAGSLNGEITAFNTANGAELWSDNTNVEFTGVRGNVGDGGTIENAGQVVAESDLFVNSGYNTFGTVNQWQAGSGNALFIYRLSE